MTEMRIMRWLHFDHSVLLKQVPTLARAGKAEPKRGRTGQLVYGADRAALRRRDNYLTRPGAAVEIWTEHLPQDREGRLAWWEERRDRIRRDGRVQERLIIGLPAELAGPHARPAVEAVMTDIGGGRIPYLAAIHRGDPLAPRQRLAQNSHAHVDLADEDPATGRRVFGVSDANGTARLRKCVADALNRYAELHGVPVRVDPRRLEVQAAEAAARGDHVTAASISRLPGIKGGPLLKVAAHPGRLRSPGAAARLAEIEERERLKAACEALSRELLAVQLGTASQALMEKPAVPGPAIAVMPLPDDVGLPHAARGARALHRPLQMFRSLPQRHAHFHPPPLPTLLKSFVPGQPAADSGAWAECGILGLGTMPGHGPMAGAVHRVAAPVGAAAPRPAPVPSPARGSER